MPSAANYPNMLASGINTDTGYLPFELWAGESDLVTSQGTVGAADILQFQIVARSAGKIVAWDPAGANGVQNAIGFAAQAAIANGPIPYFTGGVPNHLALVWPAAVTTLDARKAAFDRTNITISSLL